jgi:hypothetical protein
MKTLTQHTVRCPLGDETASLTVVSDPDAPPSCRHREVVSCSLVPPAAFTPAARRGYFPDLTPLMAYWREADPAPVHAAGVSCGKSCLAVLNAAEPGAVEPAGVTSGACDSLELARRTQSPAMMRVIWLYGAG